MAAAPQAARRTDLEWVLATRTSSPLKVTDMGTGEVVTSTFTLGLRSRTMSIAARRSAWHCS